MTFKFHHLSKQNKKKHDHIFQILLNLNNMAEQIRRHLKSVGTRHGIVKCLKNMPMNVDFSD